ncbi:amidohydrolase family protein [Flammeovirga sp. SJP92]|uniref:metal-dependent hydrolase family protein n=1 Tax=Flammeovirga sp. SJP92 TaxID=1775430 RepID=UPI0007C64F34|nr:amidohydrolase family protein [Flammeovirga sp. SJP92]
MKKLILITLLYCVANHYVFSQEEQTVLIENANIFDGTADTLAMDMSVLVKGNKIEKIAKKIKAPKGAQVIDANGRTLSPGFIGTHEHLMFQMSAGELLTSDTRYFAYVATSTAKKYLYSGWTSVRDAAGNTFSLKTAIDKGIVEGPRIYASGAMISQSAGHADHCLGSNHSSIISEDHDILVEYGDMAVVNGVPKVLEAVREQLRFGANQIKIAVGGGTGSYADPLDVVEFTPEEIKAAVQAAGDYNTYVMAHVYNNDGIRRAIECGVKSIEHANLVDEATLQLMKDNDVWLSAQVGVYTFIPHGYTEDQANKHRQAYAGIDNMFKAAKKIGFDKIGFGTDIITDPSRIDALNDEFIFRQDWFTNAEILQQATSKSGELLGMSHRFSPGKIGVIEEGAVADILLIDGNPLEDLKILQDPENNLHLIMKDGKIFKNLVK